MQLLCFHHAGGAASLFSPWAASMPPGVQVAACQLPGRENRLREPGCRRIKDVIGEIVDELEPTLHIPSCFFGYSLGGLIAFETAKELRRRGLPLPEHLFVASCRAPQGDHTHDPPFYTLADSELIERIRRAGGTPEFVLRDPEIMSLILPIVRADLEMVETYEFFEEAPLPVSITAFVGGMDTEVPSEEQTAWAWQTSAGFQVNFFPEDHFVLQHSPQLIIHHIAQHIKSWLGAATPV